MARLSSKLLQNWTSAIYGLDVLRNELAAAAEACLESLFKSTPNDCISRLDFFKKSLPGPIQERIRKEDDLDLGCWVTIILKNEMLHEQFSSKRALNRAKYIRNEIFHRGRPQLSDEELQINLGRISSILKENIFDRSRSEAALHEIDEIQRGLLMVSIRQTKEEYYKTEGTSNTVPVPSRFPASDGIVEREGDVDEAHAEEDGFINMSTMGNTININSDEFSAGRGQLHTRNVEPIDVGTSPVQIPHPRELPSNEMSSKRTNSYADAFKAGRVFAVKSSYQWHGSPMPVAARASTGHSITTETSIPVSESSSNRTVPSAGDGKPSPAPANPTKPGVPHINPTKAHELAELQRRPKLSLTLEGIPVETYPERVTGAPPAPSAAPTRSTETNTPTNMAASGRDGSRGNGNRRRYDQPRRDRPASEKPQEDGRSGFTQTTSGERVIFIGRKTGPQGRGPRSNRGGQGRGRGGYRGVRNRGGNDTNPTSGDNTDNTNTDSTVMNNTGNKVHSPGGSRGNRRGGSASGRGSNPQKSSAQRGDSDFVV